MAKPKLTPQTPGEPVNDQAEQPAEPAEAEVTNDHPTTTETDMAESAAKAPVVVDSVPAAPAGLPDESEIDPKAIERPVLTKQGWVVPAK